MEEGLKFEGATFTGARRSSFVYSPAAVAAKIPSANSILELCWRNSGLHFRGRIKRLRLEINSHFTRRRSASSDSSRLATPTAYRWPLRKRIRVIDDAIDSTDASIQTSIGNCWHWVAPLSARIDEIPLELYRRLSELRSAPESPVNCKFIFISISFFFSVCFKGPFYLWGGWKGGGGGGGAVGHCYGKKKRQKEVEERCSNNATKQNQRDGK